MKSRITTKAYRRDSNPFGVCQTISVWMPAEIPDWILCRWRDSMLNWNSRAKGIGRPPCHLSNTFRHTVAVLMPLERMAASKRQRRQLWSPTFWQLFVRVLPPAFLCVSSPGFADLQCRRWVHVSVAVAAILSPPSPPDAVESMAPVGRRQHCRWCCLFYYFDLTVAVADGSRATSEQTIIGFVLLMLVSLLPLNWSKIDVAVPLVGW